MLQYETFEPVNNFVDTTLSSNFLSPLILLQPRISNSYSILIDNIFCNVNFNKNIISGNFTSTVFHLPQFAIIENFFANSPKSESKIFIRNWRNFDQNLFISDSGNVSWGEITDVNKENVNFSFNNIQHRFIVKKTCTIKTTQ